MISICTVYELNACTNSTGFGLFQIRQIVVSGKGVVFLLHIHSPLNPSVVNLNQEIRCDNEMVRIKSISKSIWEEVDFGHFVFIPPINAIESTT